MLQAEGNGSSSRVSVHKALSSNPSTTKKKNKIKTKTYLLRTGISLFLSFKGGGSYFVHNSTALS
jgi:hypothetical protein